MEKRVWLFLVAFFHLSCNERPAHFEEKRISRALLQKDFSILRKTLEEAHPGLYWYSSRSEMDRRFDSTYALINKDLSRVEFFRILLPLIAQVRCVHTSIGMLPLARGQQEFKRLIPLNVFCKNERAFILRDLNRGEHKGAEILSINGIPVRNILSKVLDCIPSDGFNTSFKYQVLRRGAFREGYALYFGQPEKFTLELKNGLSKETVSYSTKAINPDELPTLITPKSADMDTSFDAALHMAVLTLKTFEIDPPEFKASIAAIFKTFRDKAIRKLVIDLRSNAGGNNDNVSELFSYIAAHSFRHLKSAEMNGREFSQLKYSERPQAFDHLRKVLKANGNYDMSYRYSGTQTRQPVKDFLFDGDVFVLTSGNTTSAASEFAAIARSAKRAIIVGEETGGCYYGATGGIYINLLLPASKLTARIPTIRITTAVDEDIRRQPAGRGVMPDIPASPEVDDILQNRDIALEKVRQLIITNTGRH